MSFFGKSKVVARKNYKFIRLKNAYFQNSKVFDDN